MRPASGWVSPLPRCLHFSWGRSSVVVADPADPMLFFDGSVQFSHAPLGGLFGFNEFKKNLFEGEVFLAVVVGSILIYDVVCYGVMVPSFIPAPRRT